KIDIPAEKYRNVNKKLKRTLSQSGTLPVYRISLPCPFFNLSFELYTLRLAIYKHPNSFDTQSQWASKTFYETMVKILADIKQGQNRQHAPNDNQLDKATDAASYAKAIRHPCWCCLMVETCHIVSLCPSLAHLILPVVQTKDSTSMCRELRSQQNSRLSFNIR
ncbi:MAG TPA: hypothetical protein VFT06_10110, partial [Flavisolibacter sp.]|nr:hypothetical protein [Flavisolibacter sp.]